MHIEHRLDAFSRQPPAAISPRLHPRVGCVLPCLNELENLRVLLPELAMTLSTLCSDWEIVVVDDGSSDDTAHYMQQWVSLPGFEYIQLSRNFGKEAALCAGLEASSADVVISLDADLQHSPGLIAGMLDRWRAGADMVYAVREHRDDESWFKRLGSKGFYRLLGAGRGVDVPANSGDFRLMDRKVIDALIALPERTRFMKGLYAWVGFRSEAMFYTPADRLHGNSRFSLFKLIGLALDGLTAFTTWPLRLLSLVGFFFSSISFGYGVYLVFVYFQQGNAVSGWTTMVTALLFFAGVNLISLGIVGEYVGRIFNEVKGRPLYVVRARQGLSARGTPERGQ